MKSRSFWSLGAVIAAVYISTAELMYCWYETDTYGAGGMIVGHLLVAYSFPGHLVLGDGFQYRAAQVLGFADGHFTQYFWPRFVTFQAAIMLTVALILGIAAVLNRMKNKVIGLRNET